ncbi:hypothetical protein [Arthrobacter sp. Soil763]|uniref:hypothetical protein n=1 Tax=Arthrobacter sp. Soil763 TaxID=1736402 RepID=UPI000A4AA1F8|nr:hypothetical protein [Arthrobacter sp. Soil763]
MPHLLLSTETRTRHAARSPETPEDLEPLRRQVSAIIDAILNDTKPDEAPVREQLRHHVADNPGEPEKALLNHLLAISTAVQDEPA